MPDGRPPRAQRPRPSADESDRALLAAVRAGDLGAYDVLYRRHRSSVTRVARRLLHQRELIDDAVAEAFTRTFQAIRRGSGPDDELRPYLLAALRTSAMRVVAQHGRYKLEAEIAPTVDATDLMAVESEREIVARAFLDLPERWRTVLHLTEVEGRSVTEVALVLGLTPNGVSALAFRAREALRAAYLQAHLRPTADLACAKVHDRFGRFVRDALGDRDRGRVTAHLAGCRSCREAVAELREISALLRPVGVPASSDAPPAVPPGPSGDGRTLPGIAGTAALVAALAAASSLRVLVRAPTELLRSP